MAWAQLPVQNIDRSRHGNLASAQQLVRQAVDRRTDVHRPNYYKLGGHADRAKACLRKANEENRRGADAAPRR